METLSLPLSIAPAKLDELRTKKPGQPGQFESDAALDALAEAGKKVSEVCQRIAAIAEAVSADETRPEAERARLIRERVKPLGSWAVSILEASVAKVRREIAAIDAATAAPEAPRDAGALQQERVILDRLAAMSPKARKEIIAEAEQSGNDAVLGAIMRNVHFASGVTSSEREMIRAKWRMKTFPAQVKRREALEQAARVGETVWGVSTLVPFLERAMNLSGAEKADRVARRAAEVLAAE